MNKKDGDMNSDVFKYPMDCSLYQKDFHVKTMRLLKLAYAAMIYQICVSPLIGNEHWLAESPYLPDDTVVIEAVDD